MSIGVTDGKIENLKKEGKMRISIIIFNYTKHFTCLKVYKNFIILNQVVAEKSSLTEKMSICAYIGVTEGKFENTGSKRS